MFTRHAFRFFVSCLLMKSNFVTSQESDPVQDRSDVFKLNLTVFVDFWYKFDHINDFTKSIIIIEGQIADSDLSGASKRVYDFQTNLIQHLNMHHSVPLVVFKASTMTNITFIRDVMKTLQKEIFIYMYDSLESFESSLHMSESIYSFYNGAHFIIVITVSELASVSCDSENMLENLKRVTGRYFRIFLESLNVVEVIFIFPYLCNKEFLTKCDVINKVENNDYGDLVSIITKDNFDTISLQHKYKSFNGYPLRINLFPRVPTVTNKMPRSFMNTYFRNDIKMTRDIGGLDGMVLGNLVKRMNFTPIIESPTDNAEYGHLMNKTFTGSLGDIVNKRMDISLNSRFVKIYYTDDIEFTYPIFYDQFCLLAPKAQQVPNWITIFLIFNVDVWILILTATLSAGFVWWFKKTKLPEKHESRRVNHALFYFIDIALLVISYPVVLPKAAKERLFIAFCLVFNLIVAGVFQGQLSTVYSTISYYKDINTLKELDESGLPIATSSTDIFGTNVSAVGNSLSKKIVKSSNISALTAAKKKNLAVVERRNDATAVIELFYTNKYGDQQLHIVNECPRTYHLSYIVYKGYPFLNQINTFLERSFGAGLTVLWYHHTEFSLLLKERIHRTDRDEDRKLTIIDVQTSFMFLAIGLILSFCVFVYEKIKFRIKARRKLKLAIAAVKSQLFESRYGNY